LDGSRSGAGAGDAGSVYGVDEVISPYFQSENVTLYNADCLELLPQFAAGSIDAVITDPPYGNGTYVTDKKIDNKIYKLILELAKSTLIFGYPETLVKLCVEIKIIPAQWMTWYPTNKPNNSKLSFPLIQVQESIALFGEWNKDAIILKRRSDNNTRIAKKFGKTNVDIFNTKEHDVFTDAAPGMMFNSYLRQHPNEKPISLMKKLVELVSIVGNLILDPFMGSGTTGVACVQTGRKFIGIEISRDYCDIAVKRIRDAEQQMRLF
jgi:site-specific DNA-methyltransferase (adenine-specific)